MCLDFQQQKVFEQIFSPKKVVFSYRKLNCILSTYPRDIHLMYIAAFSGLILIFIPVTNMSSYVTADSELSAEATVL